MTFEDNIFKCIRLKENVNILILIPNCSQIRLIASHSVGKYQMHKCNMKTL